jgi:hypothetical protein
MLSVGRETNLACLISAARQPHRPCIQLDEMARGSGPQFEAAHARWPKPLEAIACQSAVSWLNSSWYPTTKHLRRRPQANSSPVGRNEALGDNTPPPHEANPGWRASGNRDAPDANRRRPSLSQTPAVSIVAGHTKRCPTVGHTGLILTWSSWTSCVSSSSTMTQWFVLSRLRSFRPKHIILWGRLDVVF